MISVRPRAVGLVVLSFFLLAPAVSAAPVGVTVAPIRYTINLDPGQSYEDVITVANPNDFILRVQPEFQDFRVTEGNTIQWIPSDIENPYRMTDWISINRDMIVLKPHEEARIPFSVLVPSSAHAGGRYAAIFFSAVLGSQDQSVGAVPRVGALIILNVNGNLERSGRLTALDVPKFVGSGPVLFTIHYLNTGTTHYESTVNLKIKNLIGRETNIPVERRIVYPGVERKLAAQWETSFPFGIYRVSAEVTDGNGVIERTDAWIIGIPIRIVIPLLVILALLFSGWKWFRAKFKIVRATA
jgi:hypothetical protein